MAAAQRVNKGRFTELPFHSDPLIGRAQELTAARSLILRDDVRLLTLTGPPGTGKTRLALAIASELPDVFESAVFFVDLSQVRDPGLVMSAIASAVGIRDEGQRPLLDSIRDLLEEKTALLLLDNFEQVLDAAREIAALLSASAGLKILITSRAPLRLTWEREFPVPPLLTAEQPHRLTLAELAELPAIDLFVHRTQAVIPGFSLSVQNAVAIGEICKQLDGLPLAIELAAARTRMFSPEELVPRLGNRLNLLSLGKRDAPARHRTLSAALDWSYELLGASEQELLRYLGVFSGGCTASSLTSIANVLGRSNLDLSTDLGVLIENSLVTSNERSSGETRYQLLETVREYAIGLLEDSGEANTAYEGHCVYFSEFADRARRGLAGPEQASWRSAIDEELNNMRSAFERAVTLNRPELAVAIASALWLFPYGRRHLSEGRQRIAQLLTSPCLHDDPLLRARSLLIAGELAVWQSAHHEAKHFLEESRAAAESVGNHEVSGQAMTFLGRVARDLGDDSSTELAAASVDRLRSSADPLSLGVALHFYGLTLVPHQLKEARLAFEESLHLLESNNDRWDTAMPLRGIGMADHLEGDFTSAKIRFEQSMARFEERDDRWGVALLSHELGCTAYRQRDYLGAATWLEKSIGEWSQLGNLRGIVSCFAAIAALAASSRLAKEAARLTAVVDALVEFKHVALEPTATLPLEDARGEAANALGSRAFRAAWAEGSAFSVSEATETALEVIVTIPERVTQLPLDELAPLSRREGEVARLVSQGLTNRQIGEELVISAGTANLHVKHILNKLGFFSRSQIAAWVAERVKAT